MQSPKFIEFIKYLEPEIKSAISPKFKSILLAGFRHANISLTANSCSSIDGETSAAGKAQIKSKNYPPQLSGYQLYVIKTSDVVKNAGFIGNACMSELGRRWKLLTENEKQEWREKAKVS